MEKQENLDNPLNSIPVAVFIVDKTLTVAEGNLKAKNISSSKNDTIVGKKIGEALQCTYSSDAQEGCGHGYNCRQCNLKSIISNTIVRNQEYEMSEITLFLNRNKTVGEIAFLISTSVLYKDGEKMCIFTLEDITQRKLSENKYSNYFNSAFNNAPLGLMIIGIEGNIIKVNTSATQLTGYSQDELLNMNVTKLFYPIKIDNTIKELINSVFAYNRYEGTMRIYTRNNTPKKLAVTMIKLNNNTIILLGEDIGDSEYDFIKKNRKEYLESIIELNPNAIVILNTENQITECNSVAEQIFDYKREEVIGKRLDALINNKSISQKSNLTRLDHHSFNRSKSTEIALPTKENEIRWFSAAIYPLLVHGNFVGSVVSFTDISSLKQKEDNLKSELQRREILEKEIHHRVKNHMNTISSIIYLKTTYFDDSKIKIFLNELENRIRLMQNIYQTLYTGNSVTHINIPDFLIPMIQDVKLSYLYNDKILLETNIEDLEVTSKQSLHIGIIILELINNSIKYAFQDPVDEGLIFITIHTENDNFIYIEVMDTGRGIPSEIIDRGEYGFGLTLIKNYASQFDGTMTIDNKNGTIVRVLLKLD